MIELSDKFQLDISSNTYSIQPLIVIDADNNPIYISTYKQSFNIDEENSVYWEDYDLNISNITESINLKTRNFKTGNINFKLTNYKVKDKRFSDDITQFSIINKYVDIYYKTQSCKTLDDCAKVYRGVIKSVKHDSKTIRITLEDLTEDKLNMEVPIASLGYTDKVFNDKYLNKEIPITYGDAFKAPAVLYLGGEESDSLFAITDDVFDDSRNINLGSFSGVEIKARQFTAARNSLYIYKDEYFQVFEQFKHGALGNNDNNEWDWEEKQQYSLSGGNHISIPRKFEGGLPSNPPAFNELQTFIIRNPVQMMLASNIPNNSYGAFYLQDDVLEIEAPALAIDNPDYQFLSSNYNVDVPYGQHPYLTHASIPPTEGTGIESEFEGKLLVNNFFAHEVNDNDRIGCWLPRRDDDVTGHEEWDTYQFKIFQYLNFNMDKLNRQGSQGLENIYKVSYVQMPSLWDICARIHKFWLLSWDIPSYANDYDAVQEWKDDGAPDNAIPSVDIGLIAYSGIWEQMSCQAYPQMCTAFRDHWNSSSVCNDEIDWGSYNGDGDGGFADSNGGTRYYPQPTVFRITPSTEFLSAWESGDQNDAPFYSFCVTQKTAQMTGAGAPENLHWEANQQQESWTGSSYDLPSMEGSDIPTGKAKHFNLFYDNINGHANEQVYGGDQIKKLRDMLADPYHSGWGNGSLISPDFGGLNYLFLQDEIPTYTPVDRVARYRGTSGTAVSWMAAIGYRCLWNGVEPNQFTGQNGSSHSQGRNAHKFFGVFGDNLTGYGCWTDEGDTNQSMGTHPIEDKHLYKMGNPDTCWAIYVHENINGIEDEEILQGDDYDQDFQTVMGARSNLIIPEDTVLPTLHMTNTRGNGTWDNNDQASFGEVGEEEFVSSFIKLYDHDEDENLADNRFGVVFQLSDINETDSIKCDTFFTGKVEVEFDVEGTSDNDADFELVLKTASIEDQAQDADSVIRGDDLMDFNLSEAHNNSKHIWSVVDQDANPPSGTVNHFITEGSGSGLIEEDVEWISQSNWTEPNAYNGFGLHYLVNSDGEGVDGGVAYVRTKIYDAAVLQVIQFENAFESDIYINKAGRINNDDDKIEIEGSEVYKYTGTNAKLIESPQDILYHFIEKELNMDDLIDEESLILAREENDSLKYAFSIKEKIKAKDFINDFVKSTKIFPIFKSTSKFGFSTIKSTYSNSDVSMTIKNKDIISYSFSRTPINDIRTIVNVKYQYDYAKDKFLKESGYVDGYDLFGNIDLGYRPNGYSYDYLKLDREDNVLEFESKYIRDDVTALALRNYIYLWNCNQHNIFELTLPNKYINLEAGDIIKFQNLIEDVKAYGEDYTKAVTRNGQVIYPYFIINHISKKANGIKVKCTQLHELERKFMPAKGSVTRNRQNNESFDADGNISYNPEGYGVDIGINAYVEEDIDELQSFLNGSNKYFTRDQRRVSDINLDGYIDDRDKTDLQTLFDTQSVINTGDLNLDGVVNVTDLVALITYITGDYELNEEALGLADLNEDGTVNVVDVVALVNQILGNSGE